tara:strand:+ start:379 stop:1356 length:978 start_codon:yes stop_codon:yes gene_type:complete
MKYIYGLVLTIFLANITGCATKTYGPIEVKKNIYLVEREEGAFPLNNLPLLKEATEIAVNFCQKNNKKISVISQKTNPGPYIMGNYPKGSVFFNCVHELSSLEQDSIVNRASFCLTKNAIEYDDGISEVSTLSKAIVNQCYDPCVTQKIEFLNNSESYFYERCVSEASDAIYKTRNIKRQGGAYKIFNDFVFSKRKGDGHFSLTLSTFNSSYTSILYLYCSDGTYSKSLDTHYLSLSNNAISELGLSYKNGGVIELSVNGMKHQFIYDRGMYSDKELKVPLPSIAEYINSNEIVVSHKNKTIVFNTKGYMDARATMIKECPTIIK